MAVMRVHSTADALGAIGRVLARIADWRTFWDYLSAELQVAQADWFRRGLGRPSKLSRDTILARATRQGYYNNAKTKGVGATGPKWVWTGLMRKSTAIIVRRTSRSAVIDTQLSYTGPIDLPDPVGTLLVQRGYQVWDEKLTDQAYERAVEKWLQAEILRR